MPNILLTQKCVRSCPYCFARRHMKTAPSEDLMTWEDLIYLADLIEAFGKGNVSLLGGEPTLHPEFIDFALYLVERDFTVTIFTSGIMSQEVLEEADRSFRHIPIERLSFVCNLNDPRSSPPAENERVGKFLETFGARVMAGFNIYRTEFDMSFLFDHINRHGLRRDLRVGLAHPILGAKNSFVRISDIEKTIRRLCSYFPLMERLRIKPGLDCGFPLCKFSDRELGWLYKFGGGHNMFECGPALDIGPDMSIWPCFPLSHFHRKSVFDFDSLGDILKFYSEIHNTVRTESSGIYEECDTCNLRRDRLCAGGCISQLLIRFSREAPVRLPEVYA